MASREIGKENIFFVAMFTGEDEIPLAGGQRAHAFWSSISNSNGREERGLNVAVLIRPEAIGRQGK